ncbi:MAG: hypothetical protein LBR68_07345 [Lachnoclostridium sp.]|jgi:hypothetical protein|nr:hypothetical protein [Lachnoclostridium sp.]
MNLDIYYRISDKGNPKEKIPQADKFSCIRNIIHEFGSDTIHIIADNCTTETVSFIKGLSISHEETSLGNSGPFIYMISTIIKKHKETDYVYLVEDDYIHLGGSRSVLEEGLAIADYVIILINIFWKKTVAIHLTTNVFIQQEFMQQKTFTGGKQTQQQ